MPKGPLVSVVVPNWNGEAVLGACLESLRRQTHPAVETIVVDNGSRDRSRALLREAFPEVISLPLPTNRGFSAAVNAGIRRSSGEYVALLNNDAEADPAWLAELVRAIEARPEVGFCASRILLHDRPDLLDACGDYFTEAGFAGKIGYLERAERHRVPRLVAGACAAASLYRRRLFEDVGLFDEDFFFTHEDTDLSLRAQLLGHACLFVPTALVRHRLNWSIRRVSWRHRFYTYRNEEYAYVKNMPGPLLLRSLPRHLATAARRFGASLWRDGAGAAGVFLLAKAAFVWHLPAVLRKRARLQARRRISPDDFAALLGRPCAASS